MKRVYAALMFLTLVVAGSLLAKKANGQQATPQPVKLVADPKTVEHTVPAELGPSWLKNLGLTVEKSHMGQMGGSGPSAAGEAADLKSVMQRFLTTFRADPDKAAQILNEKFVASGADLYRWNCQSCHGPEGKGAEPEINPVLGPIQATSLKMTKDRMAARGIDADDDMVKQMSELAETSLRDRLQHGGKSMPAFAYLRNDEVEALLGHLEKLAGVPPSDRQGLRVPESAGRIGEHITRGTCHICHDSSGPGNGLSQARIPSLASIPRDHSLSGMVHQVQFGSSATMKLTGADVMPAYPYFTEEEIAAAYFAAAFRNLTLSSR